MTSCTSRLSRFRSRAAAVRVVACSEASARSRSSHSHTGAQFTITSPRPAPALMCRYWTRSPSNTVATATLVAALAQATASEVQGRQISGAVPVTLAPSHAQVAHWSAPTGATNGRLRIVTATNVAWRL